MVQALKEQVMSEPVTVPTPCFSPPPLSAADSMKSCNAFHYTATEIANISLCFLPHKHISHMIPELDLTSEMMEDDQCISIPSVIIHPHFSLLSHQPLSYQSLSHP
jgi:hypothetical protein